MILNVSFSLYVFPGLALGTDGQRKAIIKSTECSKNNQMFHWLLYVCAVGCTVVHVQSFGK